MLESRGEEIAVGIERAAAFLASSSRAAVQVRAIYTCGGGSRIPGLTDVLADRLRLSVQQANPLANLNVRDGALDSLVTDEVAPLLMLPIGLAHAAGRLRSADAMIEINLLPGSGKKAKKRAAAAPS